MKLYYCKISVFLGRLPNFGSRPNNIGVKFPSVRTYVCTSVCPQKVSSILMKFGIQVVLDDRWKEGNDHARIQGQGQSQEPMKVGNSTIFKGYHLPHL